MKHISLVIALMLNALLLSAESQNFKPGYVITLKQDTLRGEINFKTDEVNAKECYFRTNKDSKVQIFLPGTVNGYRFSDNGKYYVSHKITIDSKESTVFLEYLIHGLMNVYYYKSNGQSYYFFEKENGKMQMVTKGDDQVVENKVIADKQYDGELRYIFQNNLPEEYGQKQIGYNQKTMINIAKKYHQSLCTTGEECIVYENKNPDAKVIELSFAAYAGVNHAEYTMKELGEYKVSAYSPLIGLNAIAIYPRFSKSFGLSLGVSFAGMDVPETDFGDGIFIKFKTFIATPSLGIKYSYPKYRLCPVVEAGVDYTLLFGSKVNMKHDVAGTKYWSIDYKLRKSILGAYAGIGLDYRITNSNYIIFRLSKDFYVKTDGMELSGRDQLDTYQIKLGYIFKFK